jgi:ABC-2 type transport system ATP-binding protein
VSTLLSVRGLEKSFGDLQALRGVSFDAHSGEIVAVIGPNGAGKTTLLSIIAGAQQQSAGSVRCDAAAPSNEVGWAPQQPAVYSKLSVSENLRLFARLHRVADPERAVARMLEQTGLAKRAGERLERLSGGNRQRVNVAIGLIADPPVLVLDEPSASLDPGQRERLWEFVAGLAKAGRGVIFSTHNVDEAQRYADRVIVLDRGDLRFNGTPSELMRVAGEGARGDLERALVVFLARDERR